MKKLDKEINGINGKSCNSEYKTYEQIFNYLMYTGFVTKTNKQKLDILNKIHKIKLGETVK